MSTPQPEPAISPPNTTAASSLTPSQASFLLSSFANFLTVAIHSILYHRALYPAASFLVARAYNLPVHQSRHPAVCAWVRDAIAATAQQIRQGTARQICLAVHEPRALDVVERWIFDVQSFPASVWGPAASSVAAPDRDRGDKDKEWTAAAAQLPPGGNPRVLHDHVNRDAGPGDDTVNPTDVHEALRAALSRLSYAAQSRSPLPEACTFTLGVELRDEALAPIHHPQLWIPSQPSLQPRAQNRPQLGRARQGTSTTPIRAVQAGPLFFECWVEQASTTSNAANPTAPVLEAVPEYVLPSTLPSTFESSAAEDATTIATTDN
ncbi:hypothetical protein E4U21_002820 [Claviceps maximensis]|nr:hypothetical protein E4U21_002820 [Claviceps maximensis]